MNGGQRNMLNWKNKIKRIEMRRHLLLVGLAVIATCEVLKLPQISCL